MEKSRRSVRSRALVAAAGVLAALAATQVAGVANASESGITPPSSCRPANHRTTLAPDTDSAGHHHYRVTLTAAPGYDDCVLQGVPSAVVFTRAGAPVDVAVVPSQQPAPVVTFGPGAPVHLDIQVPDAPVGTPADSVSFELPGVAGLDGATGPMTLSSGVQVSPVEPGA
jgi:hypothetical protein